MMAFTWSHYVFCLHIPTCSSLFPNMESEFATPCCTFSLCGEGGGVSSHLSQPLPKCYIDENMFVQMISWERFLLLVASCSYSSKARSPVCSVQCRETNLSPRSNEGIIPPSGEGPAPRAGGGVFSGSDFEHLGLLASFAENVVRLVDGRILAWWAKEG